MTLSDPLLIAVDGGGTGCRVVIGTATQGVLADAKGGPANINTSFDGTLRNITGAVAEASEKAGIAQEQIAQATAHVGLAGADTSAVRDRVMAALPYGRCTVTGDRETSVVGVLGHGDGYVIALGTGTIIARQQDGKTSTVNGWGFDLSDHASGAWLGHQMMVQVLLSEDGMAPVTPLCQQISAQMRGLNGLVAFSQTAQPGDYAQFARDIFAAAKAQDSLALDLLRRGASYLEKGLTALGYEPGDVLSLSGGVGPHYQQYLSEQFTRNVQPAKGSALDGAFALAQHAAAVGR